MDQTFWQQHGDEISAAITLAVAILIAVSVDRLVLARASRMASRVTDTSVSRATQSRLRFVRRLVFAAIILIGAALALSQFANIQRLATGILASSAVLGLVAGLAGRQVLGNALAGLLLSVTQPIRIGDTVTIQDETGRVDDLTLSYTFLDPGDGRLMIVPNEMVVSSVVFNRSTGDRSAPATISVWVPVGTDLARARSALEGLEVSAITVAEMTADGVRIEVAGPGGADRTRGGDEEGVLRESAHEALRGAGVIGIEPPASG
jgi:small-conductance mechanosensitive channel